MHPGNETNQDDRQIIRRPIAATAGKNICSSRGIRSILRAIARDGNKTTFTLVDRQAWPGGPAFPPFAKSAKDGADTGGRTDVSPAVAAWGTRSFVAGQEILASISDAVH